MIVISKNYFISMISLLFLLPGCFWGKKKTEQVPLQSYTQELDGVQILVKPLKKKESEELFGKHSKRYHALELVIENNNDYYFILHPWYIGLPLTAPKKVAQHMHAHTLLVVWSMIGLGIFGVEWVAPLSPFLYASLPVGMWLNTKNKSITKSVMRDSIYKNVESIIIPPYGQIKRHFFVSKYDFTPNFTITLLSGKDNKPVRFGVSLSPKVTI